LWMNNKGRGDKMQFVCIFSISAQNLHFLLCILVNFDKMQVPFIRQNYQDMCVLFGVCPVH